MQPVEQAVDRHLVELPLVNGVNVVVGDMCQHVLEQARLAVHRPHRLGFVLQQPAAAYQGDRHDAGDKEQLAVLHRTPRVVCAVAATISRHAASCTACLDCDASM